MLLLEEGRPRTSSRDYHVIDAVDRRLGRSFTMRVGRLRAAPRRGGRRGVGTMEPLRLFHGANSAKCSCGVP